MSNNFFGSMAALYVNTARTRAAGFNKSFAGMHTNMQGKKEPVKWPDKAFEQSEESTAMTEHVKRKPIQEKQVYQKKAAQTEGVQTAEAPNRKSSQQRNQDGRKESRNAFSQKELQKAVVMSVILEPPVSRKRKRYEGITDRR